MSKIKVVIVDDHNALREAMNKALCHDENIDVIGTFADGRSVLSEIDNLSPDVILMDIVMPGIDGVSVAQRIKRNNRRIKVVIFTMHDKDSYIRQALKAGVSGYVLKDAFLPDVVAAIRSAYQDQLYLSPAVAKKVIEQPARFNRLQAKQFGVDLLTDREKDILKLIAEGLRIKEIAEHLNISVRTAETHRKNIMEKLDIHNVVLLTRYAIQTNLVLV